MDGWVRRKLRCLLWRHWKRPKSRARMLMKGGWATNQRGPWWNAGASHVNQAQPKKVFERPGLLSLRELHSQFRRCK
ncbi:hypothetical protein PCO86_01500 [Pectobacteriaceae bacterium CE70]|nr:hypothetical protein PCO87_01475 [Pectobacteriaceae bacterium C52]WJV68919.1 hypothetical protein PCO86_01500 [Pectobacteriaceae bacterium CE70]WJY12859.1 hypothetical protein PCO80_01500 [Pectobacteriaceae bacterium C80]